MNTKNEFDDVRTQFLTQDINSCFEIVYGDKQATDEEISDAIEFMEVQCNKLVDDDIYYQIPSSEDVISYYVDDYLDEKPLQFIGDHYGVNFEDEALPELHELCRFFAFLSRSEAFQRLLADNRGNGFVVCTVEHEFFESRSRTLDALYFCLFDDNPYKAIQRQIKKIEKKKRPFIFFLLSEYLKNSLAEQKHIILIQKCLLAYAAGEKDFSEKSYDGVEINIDTASIGCSLFDKSKFHLNPGYLEPCWYADSVTE